MWPREYSIDAIKQLHLSQIYIFSTCEGSGMIRCVVGECKGIYRFFKVMTWTFDLFFFEIIFCKQNIIYRRRISYPLKCTVLTNLLYWILHVFFQFCLECKYSDWGEWSPCSRDCDVGSTSRSRSKLSLMSPEKCPDDLLQTKDCNIDNCPMPSKYRLQHWQLSYAK